MMVYKEEVFPSHRVEGISDSMILGFEV